MVDREGFHQHVKNQRGIRNIFDEVDDEIRQQTFERRHDIRKTTNTMQTKDFMEIKVVEII